MRRRDFIAFAGSVVAWPLTSHARQTALPVIGFVNSASRQAYAPQPAAFLKGLSEVIAATSPPAALAAKAAIQGPHVAIHAGLASGGSELMTRCCLAAADIAATAGAWTPPGLPASAGVAHARH